MKNKIISAFNKIGVFMRARQLKIQDWARRAINWRNMRAFTSKYGYYCALAMLLIVLGVASNAYRNRGVDVKETPEHETPVRVSAVITPVPTQTPAPEIYEPEYIWPVNGDVMTEFAPDTLIWNASLSQWQTHPAIDISANAGETVYACGDGVVEDAYSDPLWGNVIVILHADGMRSTYANLNTLNLVSAGRAVEKGDAISAVGKSAAAETDMAWHLHFAFENSEGEPVDFTDYVKISE